MEVINAEIGGNYTLPPAGNQAAVCVGLILMGTLEETYEGHLKKQKKVILTFELVTTNHVFDEKKGNEPFLMHKEFTFSLNAKAKLRKMLNEWSGTKFTDEDAAKFNLAGLVGAPCFVNVVHDKNKKGEDRAEIISVAKAPDGIAVPPNRTPLKVFNVSKSPFQTEVFTSLPAWIQKKIESSDEYKAIAGTSTTQTNANALPGSSNPFGNTNPFGGTVTADNAAKMF